MPTPKLRDNGAFADPGGAADEDEATFGD